MHDRERQAGNDAPAVQQDGAGAAGAQVAALLGAGEIEVLAQDVEQRLARIEVELPGFAVDDQLHTRHLRDLLRRG